MYFEKLVELDSKLGLNDGFDLSCIAAAYDGLEDYDRAISYYKKSLSRLFKEYKTSENEIRTKGVDNSTIGNVLFGYAVTLIYGKNDTNSGNYIMSLSAKCNYEIAIDYCNENGIKYHRAQSLFE